MSVSLQLTMMQNWDYQYISREKYTGKKNYLDDVILLPGKAYAPYEQSNLLHTAQDYQNLKLKVHFPPNSTPNSATLLLNFVLNFPYTTHYVQTLVSHSM
jgi:hypothetical protein